jgi:hypothetical protein
MNITTTLPSNELSTQREVASRLAKMWLPNLVECMDWAKHLEYIDASSKRLKAEALRRELLAFDDLLAQDIPVGWRLKEYRRRTVITLAGKITYLRRIYIEECGISHALLDEALGIRTRKRLAPDAFVWLVKTAAEMSFRKTARMFFELTGAKVSRWLVWECVQEEGRLILEDIYEQQKHFDKQEIDSSSAQKISQDTLFLEYDGIHIHEQKASRSPLKRRRIYEHNRHRRSFELKGAVVYAGKDSKGRRVGLTHFISNAAPVYFWPLLSSHIASVYEPQDIDCIYVSSDGAGWCKNADIAAYFPHAQIHHQLDIHHVNTEIIKAAKDSTEAALMLDLTYSHRTDCLLEEIDAKSLNVDRVQQDRYFALRSYLANNKELIDCPRKSMGSMEGTWAHVIAARMKAWGGGWSRHGGFAMALVRSRIASKLPLVVFKPDNVLLSEEQHKRRLDHERAKRTFNFTVPEKAGHGYEPPQGSVVLTTHMAPDMYGWLNYP